jgi:hypothetical protein
LVEVLEIDAPAEESKKKLQIRAYMFNLKSGKDFRLVYPVQLEPSSRIQYFEVNLNSLYLIE